MMLRILLLNVLIAMPSLALADPVTTQYTLTLDGARRVVTAVEHEAASRGTTGAIAVVDAGGNLIAMHRIDGTFPAGPNIAIGKARTAAIFQRPTRVFEELITKGRTPMIALNDFTPLQGGVPIVMGGRAVGAVGVSGASSAQEDDDLAQIGADALTHSIASANAAAVVVEQPHVEQAFGASDLGGTLHRGANGSFIVNASRRRTPGDAEVHLDQTDVFYILSGQAEFVAGGHLVGAEPVAQSELRAALIQDGVSRTLRQGDVVVVPAGTPHWFRAVSEPMHYLVVKVTVPAAIAAAR